MASYRSLPKSYVWRGILGILLGLVLMIWPSFTATYIVTILGTVLLTIGVILLVSYYTSRRRAQYGLGFPAAALLFILAGILLVAMPSTFGSILIVVMGLLLVLGAADQLYMLWQARKAGIRVGAARWIIPVLVIAAGVVVAFNPWDSMKAMLIVFGAAAVIYGAMDLLDQYLLRSKE